MEDAKANQKNCSIQELRHWLKALSRDSRIESRLDQDDLEGESVMGFARVYFEQFSLLSMEALRQTFPWYCGRGLA